MTPWPAFTDHSIVTASVSYQVGTAKEVEELHLLESGGRLKQLNFNKAPWPAIQERLRQIDWDPMKEAAKVNASDGLSYFMEVLLPLLEELVPLKGPKRRFRSRLVRNRKLLWRKLCKIQRKIQVTSSPSKLSQLIQDKWELELELRSEYSTLNDKEEEAALQNMKENPKSFFTFAKSRQKTKARIGPFIDPATGSPNPDPDFAASVLSDQYQSVFVQPRPEWLIDNAEEFFTNDVHDGPSISDIEFTESDRSYLF